MLRDYVDYRWETLVTQHGRNRVEVAHEGKVGEVGIEASKRVLTQIEIE